MTTRKTALKKKILKEFTAMVYSNDMFDNPHRRRVKIKAKNKNEAERILKNENGVFDVEMWD